jgi:hypothetical protein
MKWLVTIWAALMGLDFLTTKYALEHGHQEANPIMAPLFEMGGWPAFAVKMAAIGIIVWVTYRLRTWRPMRYWMLAAVIAMLLVVTNNVLAIARA